MLKTVKNAAGVTAGDHETPVPDLKGKKLTIVIPLPEEIRNRAPYFVYKVHGGTVSAVGNTYQEEHQTLTIRADEFSIYAIAYTQERYRLNMTQVLSGKEDGCRMTPDGGTPTATAHGQAPAGHICITMAVTTGTISILRVI